MTLELERYSNSFESDQAKQILQEIKNLETLTIPDFNHFIHKIKSKINEIEKQKQC